MPARVFILIPAYNIGHFLTVAIDSVLTQTYQDWELLVLDDCSTDNTTNVVAAYLSRDARIQYLRNEENLGMLKNWNKGIAYCQSPYFAKLDGDDKWHPDMIQSALNILDHNQEVGMVFSKYVSINQVGEIVEGSEMELPHFAKDKSFSCVPLVQQGASKMLSYPVLRQGLSLMRSKIFLELGAYRFLLTESTQASTDTEFYFRIGCHYNIHCINKVLYFYRVHPQSISALDYNEGLSTQKMYEIKTVINDYYISKNKIELGLWRKNKAEIEFGYTLFLHYESRHRKQFLQTLILTLKLLVFYPLQTWHHLLKRIKSDE